MLTLADLLEGITGQRLELPEAQLKDVVIDSRKASEGSLFVALRGEHEDGHDFIADAFERGAIAAIAERRLEIGGWRLDIRHKPLQLPISNFQLPAYFIVDDSLKALQRLAGYWRGKFNCEVIGVTGSVGKTTTKETIASVLAQSYQTLKSEGNYNNEIGLPLALLRLNSSYEKVVLEMGMYALGEIAELANIARPHIGVVTQVSHTHLERLGTIERIAQAKAELVEALPADGAAILNGDDPLIRPMAAKTKARVLYYGLDPNCDLWASDVESHGLEGISFLMHHRGQSIRARLPSLGRHNVYTALAAAAVGLVEGQSWAEIVAGLRGLSVQLRLFAAPGIKGTTIIDDTYNSSPASSLAALSLLEELTGRRIAVLGDMLELGSFEEEGHRIVGRRAAEVVAKLIAVGPRGRVIGEEALRSGMRKEDVLFAANNAQAIEHLTRILVPRDMILVKGSRGMRMEEIVAALSMAKCKLQFANCN